MVMHGAQLMQVISYYNVVPTKNKSQEKYDILTNFVQGVNAAGDFGEVYHGNVLQKCDVGIIQGWTHERGKSASHLRLRQDVIDSQINKGKYVISGDANLFLYANPSNQPHHYLRYSFNGVFPTTGQYCDDAPDPKRWRQIKRDLNIEVGNHKTDGRHILIAVQRNGGWSMGQTDLGEWTEKTVYNIMSHTNRPIVIRLHPGDKRSQKYMPNAIRNLQRFKHVSISPFGRPLDSDLKDCHAVVNHNSSSIVGPLIKGYPAFITDPENSQCKEVAHTDFKLIDTPVQFDRQSWLERISMFHWNFAELKNGECWKHMRKYI